MRHLILLSLMLCLLCGCTAGQPEPEVPVHPSAETIPATTQSNISETSAPEPTLPPDPLQALLDAMTTEEKVGQLFLARHPATGALDDLCKYHLGGYILFGSDLTGHTADTLKQQLQDYQLSAAIPLLLAVDEEGGTVCRVSSDPAFRISRFPSPRSAFLDGGMERVLELETEKARLLHSLGLNVNMAPVCDITTDRSAFMYDRSIGLEPEQTGQFAVSAAAILSARQVGSVLKHFPGYGNNTDTHTGIATDSRTLQELESRDLIPFAMGIDAGCDAILVSHTIVTALDDSLPASLSPSVHEYLRNTMGFEGVIVTDDLVMQAITDAYGAEEAAVLAVLAGNDLLCSTQYQVQYDAVLEAVESGRISAAMLDSAVTRVLTWKKDLGLIF